MKKFSLALLAAAAALAISPAVRADTLEQFTLTSGAYTAVFDLEVNLTTDMVDSGTVLLSGFPVSGTFSFIPGSGTSPSGAFTYDSVWVPGTKVDSAAGWLFMLDGAEFNVWYNDGTYGPAGTWGMWEWNGSYTSPAPIAAEPSSLVLLGTGLIGLALLAFRKRKPSGLVLRT